MEIGYRDFARNVKKYFEKSEEGVVIIERKGKKYELKKKDGWEGLEKVEPEIIKTKAEAEAKVKQLGVRRIELSESNNVDLITAGYGMIRARKNETRV